MSTLFQLEEKKIQEALELNKQNLTWDLAECARIARKSYPRVEAIKGDSSIQHTRTQ
jgi:hypothetical protein